MKKLRIKFREVKTRCRKIVKKFRRETGDRRRFPSFHLGCLAQDGRKGYVQLSWKPRGKEIVYSDEITYESFPELTFILHSLGVAWEATNP